MPDTVPQNFTDYISLKQFHVPKELKNRFFDSIMEDMERQKDEMEVSEIKGLQVRSRDSHAARLTGHWHYYAPYFVKEGAKTFVTPFEKPCLTHHDTHKDPIGRVKFALYVPTPNPMISSSLQDRINVINVHTKKTLGYIKDIRPMLYDKRNEGLGYLQTVSNITDPDAIEKIIDGRYHTISIGYGTDTLHCSECFTDVLSDGLCEHKKGVNYGKGPMFYIFGRMTYDERSYVNEPADELAQNEEVKRIIIPVTLKLADSLNAVTDPIERIQTTMLYACQDSKIITNPEMVPSSDIYLYQYDSKQDMYVPQPLEDQNQNGEIMKLTTFLKQDSKEIYQKIAEHLPEEKRLSEEQIAALKDSDFLGKGRLLPVIDIEHADAVEKVLGELEDSKAKTDLITLLTDRKAGLGTAPASAEGTDSQEQTQNEPAKEPVKIEITIDSEGNVQLPEGLTDENKKLVGNSLLGRSKDAIYYSFSLSANGGPWESENDKDPEAERAILELLLALNAREKKDAVDTINKILALTGDNKDEVIKEVATEILADMQVSHETLEHEHTVLKDSVTALNSTITELTGELKSRLIDSILSFKQDDPSKSKDELKKEFADQSLTEVKAVYNGLNKLFGKDTFVPAKVEEAPVQQFVDGPTETKITEEQIKEMRQTVDKEYIRLSGKDSVQATMYRTAQLKKIEALEKKYKEQNENN